MGQTRLNLIQSNNILFNQAMSKST